MGGRLYSLSEKEGSVPDFTCSVKYRLRKVESIPYRRMPEKSPSVFRSPACWMRGETEETPFSSLRKERSSGDTYTGVVEVFQLLP